MQATTQAHSAPEDRGISVNQACAQSQNPATANLKDFYQHFNSLDTSLASYYHRIPVEWFIEPFPTSQSVLVLPTVNLVFGSNCRHGCLVNIQQAVWVYTCRFGEGVPCCVKKVNDTTHNSAACWIIATSSSVVKITQHLFLEPAWVTAWPLNPDLYTAWPPHPYNGDRKLLVVGKRAEGFKGHGVKPKTMHRNGQRRRSSSSFPFKQ